MAEEPSPTPSVPQPPVPTDALAPEPKTAPAETGKKPRKLSAAERRSAAFEVTAASMAKQGYTREDLTIGLFKANVTAFVVMAPFVVVLTVLTLINPQGFFAPGSDGVGEVLFDFSFSLIVFAVGILVLAVVHEAIHGLVWGLCAERRFRAIEFGVGPLGDGDPLLHLLGPAAALAVRTGGRHAHRRARVHTGQLSRCSPTTRCSLPWRSSWCWRWRRRAHHRHAAAPHTRRLEHGLLRPPLRVRPRGVHADAGIGTGTRRPGHPLEDGGFLHRCQLPSPPLSENPVRQALTAPGPSSRRRAGPGGHGRAADAVHGVDLLGGGEAHEAGGSRSPRAVPWVSPFSPASTPAMAPSSARVT